MNQLLEQTKDTKKLFGAVNREQIGCAYKKIADLEEEHIFVIVTDYISKKQYFSDSEVIGWAIIMAEGIPEFYHIYQRVWDDILQSEIEEPVILIEEQILAEELSNNKEMLLVEATLQFNINGEYSEDILAKIKSLCM